MLAHRVRLLHAHAMRFVPSLPAQEHMRGPKKKNTHTALSGEQARACLQASWCGRGRAVGPWAFPSSAEECTRFPPCQQQRPRVFKLKPLRPPCLPCHATDVKESIAQLKYYRRSIFKKWAGMF